MLTELTLFESKSLKRFLLLSPIVVLLLTRIVIELFTQIFPSNVSWIPAFLGYYLSIIIIYVIIRYAFKVDMLKHLNFKLRPLPRFGLFIGTILIPALLPIGAFVTQSQFVPNIFYLYILIFAFINAPFEELYWRGILAFLPGNNFFKAVFTASLFSFSHFVFWGYWYNSAIIMIPTIISTFIMGLLWTHFMNKKKNIIYPILSHIVVDILNLSVAVYSGLITPPSF